jgi:hypothetical protein
MAVDRQRLAQLALLLECARAVLEFRDFRHGQLPSKATC